MCVLRAFGVEFDVDGFLRDSSLAPCAIHKRGTPRLPGRVHKSSGINIVVSDASWSDLPSQIADAEQFLGKHSREVERLMRFRGVEGAVLDFPINLRIGDRVAAQFDRFPASLVRVAGRLGLALELSIYPAKSSSRSNKRLERSGARTQRGKRKSRRAGRSTAGR
jgi:hypothetical protein